MATVSSRFAACLLALAALFTGCEQTPSPGTNEHRHGAESGHDHNHSHHHEHRQAEPQSGGRVVVIGHSHHGSGETYYHAEVMPAINGKIEFHVLTDSGVDEVVESPIEQSEIIAYVDRSDHESGASAIEIVFEKIDDTAATFVAPIPEPFLAAKKLSIVVPRIKLGGERFTFSFIAAHADDVQLAKETDEEPGS